MQLVIIAGGKGTRLKELTGGLPKPMIDIGGKPLLEHQIRLAQKHGMRDVLVLTGFGAEYIEGHFNSKKFSNLRIAFHQELRPLGTAGALVNAFDKLQPTFLVIYGDLMVNIHLERLLAFHQSHAAATLFLHPNDHPQDSDLVELNSAHRVEAFHLHPHAPESCFQNLVNGAIYVMTKQAVADFREHWGTHSEPADICRDLFPRLLAEGQILEGYRSREYLKDAGTPDRVLRIRSDYEMGRVDAGSFDRPMPAVFLDRDGTLNVENGWIHAPEQIELLPGAGEAVRAINRSGRLAVVITNQPVIARGECSESELRKIHNRLDWLLGKAHAYLDGLYFCPHHPDAGFPGERPELKMACSCRKPGTAMLEAAIRDLNIDPARSWMIGDRDSDVEAAGHLGIPGVLVHRNQQRAVTRLPSPLLPRAEAQTVLEAVNRILQEAV